MKSRKTLAKELSEIEAKFRDDLSKLKKEHKEHTLALQTSFLKLSMEHDELKEKKDSFARSTMVIQKKLDRSYEDNDLLIKLKGIIYAIIDEKKENERVSCGFPCDCAQE